MVKRLVVLIWIIQSLIVAGVPSEKKLDRPFIWVQESDREGILANIAAETWAQNLFESLRERADEAVNKHSENRRSYLLDLPLVATENAGGHPRFPYITNDAPGTPGHGQRQKLQHYVQDAVDCGVIYFLTGEPTYAQCAADILATSVRALLEMKPDDDPFNGGWIYPADHLKEARIFGAQWPLVYDFVYPFISGGGRVLDIVSGEETTFPFALAQDVFRTYVELAIHRGIIDSNWPVLESPSLVHNLLALEDSAEREKFLPYFLEKDMPEQDSLRKVASFFKQPGDMWPESLQYSLHVAQFSVYLMTVLDRLYPELGLGRRYPNIAYSLAGVHYLEFPNGDVIGFGDGQRRYKTPFSSFEVAYRLAQLNDLPEQAEFFGSLLLSGLANGEYQRGVLEKRRYSANPYFFPLPLLWGLPEFRGSVKEFPRYRTDSLPFAGIFIQRNQAGRDPVRDNLMAWVGGAHYVHGHASGMNIELYGKGEVLGHDGGKGAYRSEVHENYYRLFAAHNTVISNGASAAKGGWVELGIPTVELLRMEPMPREKAVSPNHSFSTTRFHDQHNLVAPALHERTVAVIRTSPVSGYYVDIFRAQSATGQPFHDYIYRNLGESLSLSSEGKALSLGPDDGRFSKSAKLPWEQNQVFRHPGWHYFQDVQIANGVEGGVEATFFASQAGPRGIGMHVHINGHKGRSYASVMSPAASLASVRHYMRQPAPTLVIRQEGNAWTNPFVAVYEPFEENASSRQVKSVEPLQQDGVFCGLHVRSEIEGKVIDQLILVHEDGSQRSYPEWKLRFQGHFAVVTYNEERKLIEAYIGDGQSVEMEGKILSTGINGQAYIQF